MTALDITRNGTGSLSLRAFQVRLRIKLGRIARCGILVTRRRKVGTREKEVFGKGDSTLGESRFWR